MSCFSFFNFLQFTSNIYKLYILCWFIFIVLNAQTGNKVNKTKNEMESCLYMLDNLIIMIIFWFDPVGLFRLYLLLNFSTSKFTGTEDICPKTPHISSRIYRSTILPFDIDRSEDELGNLLSKAIMAQ